MEVLFASHNPAKLKLYRSILENEDIEVIGLTDLNINYEVEETGNNPSENAIKKAKEYSMLSKMLTFADDTGLYFDGLMDDMQPGTFVRRVNGQKLTDEEAIDYYAKLIKNYGGKMTGYWQKSIAISNEKDSYVYDYKVNKIFTDQICEKRNIGFPVDSISICPEYNKYTADLTDEENKAIINLYYHEVAKFITETLKKINN